MHRDLKYLLIISLATLYLWHQLLDLVLQWEGYMYLNPNTINEYLNKIGTFHTFFNLQGIFLGDVLTRIFGTRMESYFAFEITSILVTNIAVFFLAKTLVKNSFTAFLATIFFTSNYFALADIHRPNLYAGVFLERLPINIPFMIFSFMLLHKYLEQNRVHFYIFSVGMYIFAILISHFSIFLSFPFFCYPFFFRVYKSRRFKNLLLSLLITLPYILAVIFFASSGGAPVPRRTLLEFLFASQINHYPEEIVRQLVYISQVPIVIKALLSNSLPLTLSTPDKLTPFILPTLIVYFASFAFVYKKQKQYRALLLTIAFATLAMLFSNTFIATRLNVIGSAVSNRYFFIPSILISLYWAIVLTTIFAKKRIYTTFIVLVFFIVNAITFMDHFAEVKSSTRKTKTLINFISQNVAKFPQKSLIVIGPSEDFGPYEADFFTYHIGRDKNIIFMTKHTGYGDWRPLASSSAHLVYLNFDEQCNCVKQKEVK